MRIYGLISDNGDGSNSIHWFSDVDVVESLLVDDECYYSNEGSPAATLEFPDDTDLYNIGIKWLDGKLTKK